MSPFDTLEKQIAQLNSREEASLPELRNGLLELEEFINSDEYPALSLEERTRLQAARKDLLGRIQQQESPAETPGGEQPVGEMPSAGATPAATPSPGEGQAAQEPVREHNPAAEQQMEVAEKLFYSGRYAEAIQIFDRVLQLEPNWERVKQHRSEAENYLRTGYIPAVALPADAASAYGKAQSAARVGRYADALALLEKAQSIMRDVGIQRWQEGQEFAQKLQESIDAEKVYEEGLASFQQGQIDAAIEKVDAASRATGLPKYADRALALRQVKDNLRSIYEALNQTAIDPQAASKAKTNLDSMSAEYGPNPAFDRLLERFRSIVPRVVEPLKEQTRSLKNQADRAPTLEEALYLSKQARQSLDQIRNLEGVDEDLDRLQGEIDRQQRDIQRYDNDLQSATRSYENRPTWPAEAARLSAEVRERYPNDPAVSRLSRNLRGYRLRLAGIRAGIVLLGVILLFVLAYLGVGKVRSYLLSLTPTPTPTPTSTPTLTPTATLTPTITPTPAPTDTPTLTPTPLTGIAQRDVWVRSGCYEGYPAVGSAPAGGTLRFMPGDRRFDDFKRECALVDYQVGGRDIIGWVLIMDVGAGAPATPTP